MEGEGRGGRGVQLALMEEAWATFLLNIPSGRNIPSGGDVMCLYIIRLCVCLYSMQVLD
jgi:hypothetical protein